MWVFVVFLTRGASPRTGNNTEGSEQKMRIMRMMRSMKGRRNHVVRNNYPTIRKQWKLASNSMRSSLSEHFLKTSFINWYQLKI